MSDNAIIGTVMGAFGVLTWLLGLSYFLGRNTAKLDGLADSHAKLSDSIKQIFIKLEELARLLPHVCDKAERVVRLEMLAAEKCRRLDELEHWRHEEAFRAQRIADKDPPEGTDGRQLAS